MVCVVRCSGVEVAAALVPLVFAGVRVSAQWSRLHGVSESCVCVACASLSLYSASSRYSHGPMNKHAPPAGNWVTSHTHTHTHIQTHTYRRTHTDTHSHTHKDTHTHTDAHIQTHTHTHTQTIS